MAETVHSASLGMEGLVSAESRQSVQLLVGGVREELKTLARA